MSRVDECPEISRIELHAQRVGADRGHPAAGHHFDHIDATLLVLADRGADRVRTLHDSAEVVAVAVGNSQWGAGGLDARKACAWRVTERQRAVADVAEVADRGHTGSRLLPQRLFDDVVDRIGIERPGAFQASRC